MMFLILLLCKINGILVFGKPTPPYDTSLSCHLQLLKDHIFCLTVYQTNIYPEIYSHMYLNAGIMIHNYHKIFQT